MRHPNIFGAVILKLWTVMAALVGVFAGDADPYAMNFLYNQ
jgi:hypothetical membrane protein